MKLINVPDEVEGVLIHKLGGIQRAYEFIQSSTPKQVFDAYCDYQGLVNWGNQLWDIAEKLRSAE